MRKNVNIQQRDFTDCGAACICSVAAHYKKRLSVSYIRHHAGTDQQGTSVLGLIEAAENAGFKAKGVRGDAAQLNNIPLPAIAHLILENGLHHYVVIYKIRKGYIIVMDPAIGKIVRKKIADFMEEWSGIMVLLIPGDEFQKGDKKITHVKRFWQLIRPYRNAMLQVYAGAIIFTLLGLLSSVYVQKIVDVVLAENNRQLLNLLSVLMIVALFFQMFINTFKNMLSLKVGRQIDMRLMLGYYHHLLSLPQRFFDTMSVGEVTSRMNDAVKIRIFVNEVATNLVVNILVITFSLLVMII